MTAAAANDDRRFTITIFPDQYAKTKAERQVTFAELAALIHGTKKARKDQLPWLKLATFGDKRTVHNCLRNNKNVLLCSGIEVEHDAGTMPFEEAVRRAREARVRAVLYTTASYSPAAPRWRALLPYDEPMTPLGRSKMVDRANAIFDGALSGESWTLSQAFYYGATNAQFQLEISEGVGIDVADRLAERPKPNGATAIRVDPARPLALHTPCERPVPHTKSSSMRLRPIPKHPNGRTQKVLRETIMS
jgi:hypothetical protein